MSPSRQKANALAGLELSHKRLAHLYEISKLLTRFDQAEQPFDPALRIIAKTLPLRSAVLIDAHDSPAKLIAWTSEGLSANQLRALKEHAEAAFSYLVASPEGILSEPGKYRLPRQAELKDVPAKRFLVIPLVVPRRPAFGVLQLEGAAALDKNDLMFVNAIANQLAVALNRDRDWQLDITRRERAEKGAQAADVRSEVAEHGRQIALSSSNEYQALAEENASLYEQTQHGLRMREQILAIVSHDLRNPLGTILMSTGLLAATSPEEERRTLLPESLARIDRAANRMMRLIEDLLDFASIEAGHLAINRRPEDPGAILAEACSAAEALVAPGHQKLTSQVAPRLPILPCDRDRILQVFSNLIGNSVKATPNGGHIHLSVENRDGALLYSVQDDGPGINKEDLKHLFERYWRSGESKYKGTGLGLAISKGIVVAHGGQIWCESELGRGAKFIFTVAPRALPG